MPSKKRRGRKILTPAHLWNSRSAFGFRVLSGHIGRAQRGGRVAQSLFIALGEKLPYDTLDDVKKRTIHLLSGARGRRVSPQGVYMAHDSMGCPRYIGRGKVFSRLKARRKNNPRELTYYSFYIVKDKQHEREIETLLIRAASFLIEFNDRKVQRSIEPGSVLDYEVGTTFFERKAQRTRKKSRSTRPEAPSSRR
jgi:hypothetical protein